MGLFEKIFSFIKGNKTKEHSKLGEVKKDNSLIKKVGVVSTVRIQNENIDISSVKERYIAFDVETTGLSAYSDRIIEIGAVLFEQGRPVKKFGTLVNAGVSIPISASAVNNITNEMLLGAPSEKEVYIDLIDFMGDSLDGKTVICAHNAKFDMDFLSETFMRLGFNAEIKYIDTLSLSRKLVKGLSNYKQNTVANHFNLINKKAHRAESDAEICGLILLKLIELMDLEKEKYLLSFEKNRPSEEELEVCAVIQNIIASRKGSVDLLGFYKNSSGYVDVVYIYNVIKFKFAKKGRYIIVPSNLKNIDTFVSESCTISEGGADFTRLFFNSPLDIEVLGDYIFEEYQFCRKSGKEFLKYDKNFLKEYQSGPAMNNALSFEKVDSLLLMIREKEYKTNTNNINKEIIYKREDITISPLNNRVPVDKIMNLNNWSKAFEDGYPLFEVGENLRKSGKYEEAIVKYDKARFYGYSSPGLFEGYAMAFRKLNDIQNEIDILDEGIERLKFQGMNVVRLITRRNNAIKLFIKKNTEKDEKKIKQINSETLNSEKSLNKKVGRSIIQLDDDLNVIQRFETISEAVKTTGINSKSIRDAAKRIQKHAGTFVWKYEDEFEE